MTDATRQGAALPMSERCTSEPTLVEMLMPMKSADRFGAIGGRMFASVEAWVATDVERTA